MKQINVKATTERGLGLPVQAWASQLRQSAAGGKIRISKQEKVMMEKSNPLGNDDFPIHLTENNGLGERR